MHQTTKHKISQLPVPQGVGLELDINNWYLIRKTRQTTHKPRKT
jgi:hypothetical protein